MRNTLYIIIIYIAVNYLDFSKYFCRIKKNLQLLSDEIKFVETLSTFKNSAKTGLWVIV